MQIYTFSVIISYLSTIAEIVFYVCGILAFLKYLRIK